MYCERQFLIGCDWLAEFEVAYLRERTLATGQTGRQFFGDLHQTSTRHNRMPGKMAGEDRVRSIEANAEHAFAISLLPFVQDMIEPIL